MGRYPVASCCLFLVLVGAVVTPASGQISAEAVRRAIDRATAYLKSEQNSAGNWSEQHGYPGGVSALCTLALINAGVPLDDPVVKRGLDYVRRPKRPLRTYSVALQTMTMCAADPERDRLQIRENVAWLQRTQVRDGETSGSWSYGESPIGGDPSNTQFAMLALYAAEQVGVEVQESTWRRSLGYWTRTQRKNGSWGYGRDYPSTGSMTCAGIASTIIALGQVSMPDATINGDTVDCCAGQNENEVVQNGLDWLGRSFSVKVNPSPQVGREQIERAGDTWLLYYLYGVERVGRLSGHRFIKRHDWYREGAAALLERQDRIKGYWKGTYVEGNPHVGTALALLFLSKGKRPVVIAKLRHGPDPDWNRHRSDLTHLTHDIERRWQRELSWQVIEGQATVENLLETPVLYLSGRDGLELSKRQKETLRAYVDKGGFIFAESCCEGKGFDRDFRQLIEEIFPDSELRLLPPDHPVWYAEQKVPAHLQRPLYGVDSCCRTSVVYCSGELSCYWELGDRRRLAQLSNSLRDEVQAALAIGANVITYATNRELKEKLDSPQVLSIEGDRGVFDRGTLYVAKIQHPGGSDDAPAALANLLRIASSKLELRVSGEKRMIPLVDPTLSDYPIVFMHGRRNFQFTAAERAALASFVANGGFVFADSICASQQFADSFRQQMKAAFPGQPLRPIPPDHPMFTPAFQGVDITTVRLREPGRRNRDDEPLRARVEQVSPTLEGIEIDGRMAVVFSPYDVSCALENQGSIECKGYLRQDAAKIGINVLLYAMQN